MSEREPEHFERSAMDELKTSDSISWERRRPGRELSVGHFAALVILVIGPPVVLGVAGAGIDPLVAILVGIALNAIAAWVGYKAITKTLEITRG